MPTKQHAYVTTESSTTSGNETTGVYFLSAVPFYGTVIISSTCVVLLFFCCCCMILRCRENRNAKKARKFYMKQGGLPSAGMTKGEMIQPDPDDLLFNDDQEEKPPDFRGKLHYSMEYSVKESKLTVTVIAARDLKAMDIGGTSDPYVKVRLNPGKKPVFCTKIVKSNCNPLFNETFTFDVISSNLAARTLCFYVFDHDAIGKDDLIGIISIPLAGRKLGSPCIEWEELKLPSEGDMEKTVGDVCISLRYVSASGLLNVVVLEAKNLQLTAEGDEPDTFVKVALKHDGKRLKQKKTTVRKACINPYYNEVLVFDLPFALLQSVTLVVAVATPLRISAKRLGFVEIGPNVPNARQVLHWSDMMANPRQPIARWHTLNPAQED